MSKVKINLREDVHDNVVYIRIDGKMITSIYTDSPTNLKCALEEIFKELVIENVEVILE